VARPTKLTPEVQERIVAAVRAGNHIEPSAVSAGISPATYHRWMKRGAKAKSGIYREFHEAVKWAEADAEVHAVAVVRKAMTKDWRAAFQYLERRHPDRWRRRESIEHEGTQHLVVKTEDLSDPELRKDLREIGRRIAGSREAGPDVSGDDG
jgi:transposase